MAMSMRSTSVIFCLLASTAVGNDILPKHGFLLNKKERTAAFAPLGKQQLLMGKTAGKGKGKGAAASSTTPAAPKLRVNNNAARSIQGLMLQSQKQKKPTAAEQIGSRMTTAPAFTLCASRPRITTHLSAAHRQVPWC